MNPASVLTGAAAIRTIPSYDFAFGVVCALSGMIRICARSARAGSSCMRASRLSSSVLAMTLAGHSLANEIRDRRRECIRLVRHCDCDARTIPRLPASTKERNWRRFSSRICARTRGRDPDLAGSQSRGQLLRFGSSLDGFSDRFKPRFIDHVRGLQSMADLLERFVEHRSGDDFGAQEGGNRSAADHDQHEADGNLGA